ncbi:luciferase [Nostoc sp. ATCC 43529]|nr:luciferase [Nostoc sp. ATCC 43529]
MDFSLYFFSANDRASYSERYSFILEATKYIDKNGFKAIWTPERHFQEFGGSFPNPSVLSAALAVITSNVEIRAGSVAFPLHNPIRVAEEWALIDQLSFGRVGLCLATGWHRADFILNPQNYADRRAVTFNGIQMIRDLWAGKTIEFKGVDGQIVPIQTFPRPFRQQIPLWLVHTSNPQTWLKAGELGTNVLTLFDNYDRLKANIINYRNARAQNGFDPDAGIVTLGLHTFISDSDTEVKSLVQEPLQEYLATFLKQRDSDVTLQGESREISQAEKKLLTNLAFEDLYENRSLLGSISKCANLVERLKAIGVNEIAALIDFGVDFQLVLNALPKLTELKTMFQNITTSSNNLKNEISHSAPLNSNNEKLPSLTWYFNR